eukprot:1159691-Pelagomonas_calceolata.AAC.4
MGHVIAAKLQASCQWRGAKACQANCNTVSNHLKRGTGLPLAAPAGRSGQVLLGSETLRPSPAAGIAWSHTRGALPGLPGTFQQKAPAQKTSGCVCTAGAAHTAGQTPAGCAQSARALNAAKCGAPQPAKHQQGPC